MTGWRLTQAASRDLVEAFLYGLDTFGRPQAERYRDSLLRAFENLARFPKMVRERSEFMPPLRVHHHGRHYIAYTIDDGSVLIVRIVRDEADLDYMFGS